MKIVRNPKGYYTLYVDGVFHGNFDTPHEAVEDYETDCKEKNDL